MGSNDDTVTARAQSALNGAASTLGTAPRVVRRASESALYCVVVRSAFERRSSVMRMRPAPELTDAALDDAPFALDPWSIVIAVPLPSTTSLLTRGEHVCDELARLVVCPSCGGARIFGCPVCGGGGKVEVPDGDATTYRPCGTCHGTGKAGCATCDRVGRVVATPSVLFDAAWVTGVRTVENGAMPTDVFTQVAGVELGGERVIGERGADLSPGTAGRRGPSAAAGYRDAGGAAPAAVYAAIDAMLAESPTGDPHRVINREIEVRRAPVFHVELDTGRDAWLIGTPAVVVPADALAARGGVLGWIGERLGVAGPRGDRDE